MAKIDGIPLNAFMARSGICSRRSAIDLIRQGRVIVNDEVQTEPGYKVLPEDTVKYRDKVLKLEKKVYVLLNKPKGFVTTVSDEHNRETVIDLVRNIAKERLYPVGRLDRDTTGLLIITNDGDLSQKLAHPRNKVAKRYYVVLNDACAFEDVQKLRDGIYLEDGKAKVDKINYAMAKGKNHLIVEIHGGKNRIIKRMFSHLGYKVVGLDRVYYAGLTKKDLPVGKWRHLTDEEVEKLKKS